MNRPITRSEIEPVIKKKLPTNKSPGWMPTLGNSNKDTRKNLHRLFSRSSKGLKRRGIAHSHSVKLPLPWSKTRQSHYQETELQANISDEYRCKNPWQSINKQNPTVHKKDQTPWSSWILPKVTRMVQHIQINQCDIYATSTEEMTNHDHLNRYRKIIW